MVRLSDYNARAVGIPWCRQEDYSAFLRICEDADGLPATWQEFVKFSEEAEQSYKGQGYIVERAYIDPETFPDWCRRQGMRVDSKARMRFAGAAVAEKYGRNQS
jgi:hypothetical protein